MLNVQPTCRTSLSTDLDEPAQAGRPVPFPFADQVSQHDRVGGGGYGHLQVGGAAARRQGRDSQEEGRMWVLEGRDWQASEGKGAGGGVWARVNQHPEKGRYIKP